MTSAIRKLKELIGRARVTESQIQRFMEEHTEVIPLPFLLGHQLHLQCVVSKFEVSRTAVSDFAYLTKNSAQWRLVLVELEHPQKKLFVASPHLDFHSDTSQAIAQVEEWKSVIESQADAVRYLLEKLMVPAKLAKNPLSFR